MAIDYKKEWEELYKDALSGLRLLMDNQIKRTISKRESLMKEYLKGGMKTDITGGDLVCYHVQISFYDKIFTRVFITKRNFDAWCKKKGGK